MVSLTCGSLTNISITLTDANILIVLYKKNVLLDKTSKSLLGLNFIINLIMKDLTLKSNLQMNRGQLYTTSKDRHAGNFNQSSLNFVL